MGVSKPVCLGDLGVTLCSLSVKSLPSVHLTSPFLLIPSFSFSLPPFFSTWRPSLTSPFHSFSASAGFFPFMHCGRKVWSSTNMAVTSTVMFLSLHPFSLFVIRVFCAGIYSISHWVKTHPKQATIPRHTPPHTLELLRGSS